MACIWIIVFEKYFKMWYFIFIVSLFKAIILSYLLRIAVAFKIIVKIEEVYN